MDGMVNDLQLAKEKHTRFDEWKRTNQRELPCDLHVNVLTIGFWPPYKVSPEHDQVQSIVLTIVDLALVLLWNKPLQYTVCFKIRMIQTDVSEKLHVSSCLQCLCVSKCKRGHRAR